MKEQSKQSAIIECLEEEYGCYVINVITASKAGVSDIIGCTPKGRFFSFEIKLNKTGYKATKLQCYNIAEVNRRGGIGSVIYSIADIHWVFQETSVLKV